MFLYVYMFICIYVYMYICTYVYMFVYVFVHFFTYLFFKTHVYVYKCTTTILGYVAPLELKPCILHLFGDVGPSGSQMHLGPVVAS